MNKDFFTKNIIFFIFIIPSISLVFASFISESRLLIISNLCVFVFTAHVMLKAYAQHIVYKVGPMMLLILSPMLILIFVPALMIYFGDNYNPEYHNERIIGSMLIIPSTFCFLLALPCLAAIKTAYVGLDTQMENIRIMTGEKAEYVSVCFNGDKFLNKHNFIFGRNYTKYQGISLSNFDIYSYLKENNKKLKDLNDSDIEVISMMSI